VTGLFGGAFDPPHVGHVALARRALEHFELERLLVLVAEAPWHRPVPTPVDVRLELARAAFPFAEVELDPFPSTVELLEARSFEDPIFLIGADQLAAFQSWRRPERVLELTRLGVATRPGFERERLEDVRAQLSRPERVIFFDLEPVDVSGTEIRARAARGEPIDGLVPPAVAARIAELAPYGVA
jgi:nicotinate-nucleotide adenylyltransferase